jgi:hypothetical protein
VTLDHNTVVHTMPSLVMMYGVATTSFVYTNNMGRKNEYGFLGDNNSPGNSSIDTYVPGAIFAKNIIAGASASSYPASNEPCGSGGETCYPTEAEWEAQFVNFGDGNYRLQTASPYNAAGTNGADLGADIDAITAATAGVVR